MVEDDEATPRGNAAAAGSRAAAGVAAASLSSNHENLAVRYI